MPATMTEKQRIIQQLLSAKTKLHLAEFILRMKQYDEEAKIVKERSKGLSKQIDQLIGETMSDWMGEAEAIISYLKLTNQRMQSAIDDISGDVDTTENVVKLVGYIDELVEIATAIA